VGPKQDGQLGVQCRKRLTQPTNGEILQQDKASVGTKLEIQKLENAQFTSHIPKGDFGCAWIVATLRELTQIMLNEAFVLPIAELTRKASGAELAVTGLKNAAWNDLGWHAYEDIWLAR
jgi:hypothetical protein